MLRICKTTGWVGIEIKSIEDDLENIECFAEEGTPVLICEDIETAAEILYIDQDEINIVN